MTTEPQLTQDDELLALLDAEGDAKTKILTKVIHSLKNSQSNLETEVKKFAGRTRWITLLTAFTFAMFLFLTLAGGVGFVLLSQSKEDKNTIESRLSNLQQTIAVVQATQIAMSIPVVTPSPAFTLTPISTPTPASTPTTSPTSTPAPTLSPTAGKSPSPLPSPLPSTATPTPNNPLAFWVEKLECQIGQMQQDNTFSPPPSSAPTPCLKQDSKVSIKENEGLRITFDIYANSDMNFEISLHVYLNEKWLTLLCDASPRPVQVRAGIPQQVGCAGKVALSPGDYRIEIWGQSGNKFKNKEGSDIEIPLAVERK